MKSDIRKIVVTVEETHRESGKSVSPVTRKAAAVAVIANPFAGQVRRRPDAADGHRRGTRRLSHQESGRRPSASKAARPRATARPRSWARAASWSTPPPSCTRSSASRCAKCLSKGAALIPSAKKMGGIGTPVDVPLGPQGCGVRAQPFRRHGSAHRRRAARERDPGGDRGDRFRPAVPARRRAAEERDQGRRRVAVREANMAEPTAAGGPAGKMVIRNVGLMLSGDLQAADPRCRHDHCRQGPHRRGRQGARLRSLRRTSHDRRQGHARSRPA